MKIDKKSIYHKDNLDLKYYEKQIDNTYESTKQFFKFLNNHIKLKNKKIFDLACGNGSNLIYLKQKYKVGNCLGLDQSSYLIKIARKLTKRKKINDLKFKVQNIESKNNSKIYKPDGVISIQTLSVLDDYENTINFANKLRPSFICVNSLFWEGDIDFKIRVNFLDKYSRKLKKYNQYNIYSINHYKKFMRKNGFKKNIFIKFRTKKKLYTKNKLSMGSYSVNLNNKLAIKSGPLILDWYFVLSSK